MNSHNAALGDSPDALVVAEHVKSFYRQLPSALVGSLVAAILTIVHFWPVAERTLVASWFGLLVLSHTWRMWDVYAFHRTSSLPADAGYWLRKARISATAGGALYGCLGFILFVSGSPSDQTLLLAILAGIVVASLTTYCTLGPAFILFVISIMSPAAVRLLLEGSTSALVLLLLELVFFLYILRSGFRMASILDESFTTRFANLELIEQLNEQKYAAEEANRGKSAFLAAASHDLRQPMHALSLFVAALHDHVSKEEEGRHIVERIQACVDSTEVMFSALLDVSRLDAGVLTPNIGAFSLHTMLQRLALEYQPSATAKGISLRLRAFPHAIYSDASLLEQVLRNLITNAIRYTTTGGVLVGTRRRGDVLRISVHDSGLGIPENRLGDIFKEFYQVGNPERDRAKGLGLGLAIVERIGKLLGHAVTVSSTVGRGSCFSVDVPLADTAGVDSPADPSCHDSGMALYGACILAIDDEVEIRDAFDVLLRQWGCQPIVADSSANAMGKLGCLDVLPDVIVCDYRLRGGETGIDAVCRIKETHGANIPALLLSGDTDPERLREATDSGLLLLHKPLNPHKLRHTLIKMLA